ncbi:hypothetical protein F4561_001296 [Lipingzhangella halophila]|uniref:DUF2071 domain-containing protein n=1 Tax=Lipingzhangella halophila TaxID=1783352 RepID=A0A7W7RFI3_9ACTN|nr:DUF2071 domain-containing protein [Lipingzhangella halophila]MBB4930476.1 hypothetical protein [Lipingzhangella halophila]
MQQGPPGPLVRPAAAAPPGSAAPRSGPVDSAPPGPAPLTQCWRDVVFLHWRVAPALVAPLLPPGTRPDELAGASYVGLVAFRVAWPRALGAVPTGGFNEVNVRLYTRDDRGRRGVVFRTMDADALASVVAARALTGVPYIWSDIALRTTESGSAGTVRRRIPGAPAAGRWRVAFGDRITAPSPMEQFVTARYGLHTRHLGRTLWMPAGHAPWRLFTAELRHYEGNLLAAAGVPIGERPPDSVLWSPGTTAALHFPRH